MAVTSRSTRAAGSRIRPTPDPGTICAAAALLIVLGVHWSTARELLGFGERSDSHFAIVATAFLAMVWLQRHDSQAWPVRPAWSALAVLAALSAAWVIGELGLVRVLADLAVVAMVPAAAAMVLGYRWLAKSAYPFGFLLCGIPVEGQLSPQLAAWTADVVYRALGLSGIPIARDGSLFVLPSGAWSIAETCSGAGFLGICLLLGLFYGWLLFPDARRRAAFVLGAAVLGIAGNWLRVYLTIGIAHATDNAVLRDDHSVFGWVLYALLLATYGYAGWARRDADRVGRLFEPLRPGESPARPRPSLALVGAAALGLVAAGPAVAHLALARAAQPAFVPIAQLAPAHGWRAVEVPADEWRPQMANPSRISVEGFEKEGRRVYLFVAMFDRPTWASKPVNVNNRLVVPEQYRYWAEAARGTAQAVIRNASIEVATADLAGQERTMRVWHWYWIDGRHTASGLEARVQQVALRLRGGPDTGAWLAVYAARRAGERPGDTDMLLAAFMEDMEVSLAQALDASVRATSYR